MKDFLLGLVGFGVIGFGIVVIIPLLVILGFFI